MSELVLVGIWIWIDGGLLMGLDQLTFTGVTPFLTEWFSSGLIDGAITAMVAISIGGLALGRLVRALT